ncbi:MAG: hypothetical protein Q9166_005906 [cf. Caloplaca sp. 2 TL-2023]
MALKGRVERVPALHVADVGLGGGDRTTVIGWNRSKVNKKANQLRKEMFPQARFAHSGSWDQEMARHLELQAQIHRKAQSQAKSTTLFYPDETGGIYAIKCEIVEKDWPNLSTVLRLRMIRPGRLAIFDLGIICGLMVFATTKGKVSKRIAAGKWNADMLDEDDNDSDSEDEVMAINDVVDHPEYGGLDAYGDYIKADMNDTACSPPRRLYFQWRGYNTMTGEIQLDPSNHNIGHLVFQDIEATVFNGELRMDMYRLGPVVFEGYRVSGMAGPLTMNWDAFSHLPADRAKVPRHVW